MRRLIRVLFAAATVAAAPLSAAAVLLPPAPAAAQSIDEAMAQGLIGERPDGLVGYVADSVPADLRQRVDAVNAQRMAEYRSVAEQNNVPLQQVQAVAGQRLIQRLPSGQHYMNAAGRWVRK